jgi:hypothetical protein
MARTSAVMKLIKAAPASFRVGVAVIYHQASAALDQEHNSPPLHNFSSIATIIIHHCRR